MPNGAWFSDLAIVTSSLQAAENGDTSKGSQMTAAANRQQSDGSAIDSLCSSL